MTTGIHTIAATMRAQLPTIPLDVEAWAPPVQAPAGVSLRDAPAEHEAGGEALRIFHVLPQADPQAKDFHSSLVEYEQTIDVEIRYHVPPRGDATVDELDARERAHLLAASDAARISHYFEHDYGWAGNLELSGCEQTSTRPVQSLGAHRYLVTLEFQITYFLPSNPQGG